MKATTQSIKTVRSSDTYHISVLALCAVQTSKGKWLRKGSNVVRNDIGSFIEIAFVANMTYLSGYWNATVDMRKYDELESYDQCKPKRRSST